MPYSVAIIGAGWYGCHIALSLNALGFDTTVFEQHERPLHEASGNNQFRLHLGFHYPRHYETRMQSRDGFQRFVERYPSLSGEIARNIYAVPRADSLIDFLTYKLIMTASGIPFTEIDNASAALTDVEGMLQVPERVLYLARARDFFKRSLSSSLKLGERVVAINEGERSVSVNGRQYDFLVDASWGHFQQPPMQLYYEPTILLYYETAEPLPAVTFVDGPLCAIYPTEDPRIYTLSSVVHTPLGAFADPHAARECRNKVSGDLVSAKVTKMEEQISRYWPDFRDHFKYAGPQLGIKTKPVGSHDDRSCCVFRRGRVFSVMSGKIDTIFFATERILSLIEASSGSAEAGSQSSLKQDIAAALERSKIGASRQ